MLTLIKITFSSSQKLLTVTLQVSQISVKMSAGDWIDLDYNVASSVKKTFAKFKFLSHHRLFGVDDYYVRELRRRLVQRHE